MRIRRLTANRFLSFAADGIRISLRISLWKAVSGCASSHVPFDHPPIRYSSTRVFTRLLSAKPNAIPMKT